ncbi:c-type cytochrome [Xanthobacter agilis]|uniref:c-type cytochrome n=1 Tax=Xanthobacter agilis TaxID=47492 RepID=UPI00372AD2DE
MISLPRRAFGLLLASVAFWSALDGGLAWAAAGDAAAGKVLATRWCASCHVVSADQSTAQSDAPSFRAIIRRTVDPSAEWIAFRLLAPHPLMPEVSLTQAQAADLSAYLQSLERNAD